jgi:hypothetical protein
LRYIDVAGGHGVTDMTVVKNSHHGGAMRYRFLNQVNHGVCIGSV